MGDPRRFDLMADLVMTRLPWEGQPRIVDVAGGRGGMQAALRKRDFTNVVSMDICHSYAKGRSGYKYGLFTRDEPAQFDLVVAMHPDDATDHAILYAVDHSIPWFVCPCCVRPAAVPCKSGRNDYWRWIDHLRTIGGGQGTVETITLPMKGRNVALMGNLSYHAPAPSPRP